MLSLFFAIQGPVSGRPSGVGYVLTLTITALVAGVVVALITSRFNRPSPGAERNAAIDAPRAVGHSAATKPEGARSR